MKLVVTSPFSGKEAGEEIADEREIEETLSGENSHRVVRVDTPEQPKE